MGPHELENRFWGNFLKGRFPFLFHLAKEISSGLLGPSRNLAVCEWPPATPSLRSFRGLPSTNMSWQIRVKICASKHIPLGHELVFKNVFPSQLDIECSFMDFFGWGGSFEIVRSRGVSRYILIWLSHPPCRCSLNPFCYLNA